jgi:hypothetical protein
VSEQEGKELVEAFQRLFRQLRARESTQEGCQPRWRVWVFALSALLSLKTGWRVFGWVAGAAFRPEWL